jgi:lysophospholipid acyltransferase (LPLAT)-like uncharacterized protein
LKKKIYSFLKLTIVPYILYIFTKIIFYTNKTNYHFPKDKPTKPFIVAFWHGSLLMQPFIFDKFYPNNNVKSMSSHHSDGEMMTKMLNLLGIQTIRGSSSKGGVRVLLNAISELKNNTCVAITPDGPRGPIYGIADGIIAISQKTNSDIYYFSYKATKYWQLKSWDKFIVPKPFGTIDFYVSEAFNLKDLTRENARKIIREKMPV